MAKTRASILIVDDEPTKRSILEDELQEADYSVTVAGNPLEAEPILSDNSFDIVLTDLRMPGQDGLSFLRDLKNDHPEQAVIVMTAYGTVETAVAAMKFGAFDFIQKPFSTEELLLKLDKLLRYEHLLSENEALRRELAPRSEETQVIGNSAAIRKVLARIHAVADTDTTVLVEGESGTGKELAARVLHETSHRAAGPFIAVSCAALPKELIESELFGHEAGAFTGAGKRRLGRFELAHGGTIFLDDVDDIPLQSQVKLLRVLQHRTIERIGGGEIIRVNVRVIAATKGPLSAMVADGKFREDLYYRLNVVPLQIPSLRERLEDIPFLVEHFLQQLAVKLNRGSLSISPEAVAKLHHYSWPGNVRELEHVLERMAVLNSTDSLDVNDIPELVETHHGDSIVTLSLEDRKSIDMPDTVAKVEARLIQWALDRSEGNLARAADILGIPRSTLQYKLSKNP